MLGRFTQLRTNKYLGSTSNIFNYLKKTKFCQKQEVAVVNNSLF